MLIAYLIFVCGQKLATSDEPELYLRMEAETASEMACVIEPRRCKKGLTTDVGLINAVTLCGATVFFLQARSALITFCPPY